MERVCSIFSQILQWFPRLEFDAGVRAHKAERHARGFTCWQQFVAMLFCQLGHAQSLREICGGLAATEGKLRHLGILDCPKATTLSYANAHRSWRLYQSVFYTTLERCRAEALTRGQRKFRFKHKLLSLDASMVELCAESFDWAQYKRTKGALKLHLILDHDGYLPCYAVMTEGKAADITEARKMQFESGTLLVFDRGYSDYDWWLKLTRAGVNFVTRLKDSALYGVVESRPVPENSNVMRDEVIVLVSQQEVGPEARLRRIEVWVEEKNETDGLRHQQPQTGGAHHRPDLPGALAHRTVLQGPETGLEDQDLRGHYGECRTDSDLDGVDRHADPEVPAVEEHLRLEPVQSDRAATPAVVCPPRPLEVDP